MMRSLSSAVAGLRTHQTKMDVIGNNIANVNTYGFKASRTTFADVFYQNLSVGSGPTAQSGGSNPTQIGYGSAVATIDIMNTQSGMQSTDRPMDVYITGEGFLVTQDASGNFMYTRLGNLGFDAEGNLIDPNGNYVMGFPQKEDGTPKINEDGIAQSGELINIKCDPELLNKLSGISINQGGEIVGVLPGDAKVTLQSGLPSWLLSDSEKISDESVLGGSVKLNVGGLIDPTSFSGLTVGGAAINVKDVTFGDVAIDPTNGTFEVKDGKIICKVFQTDSNNTAQPVELEGVLKNGKIELKLDGKLAMTVETDYTGKGSLDTIAPGAALTVNHKWQLTGQDQGGNIVTASDTVAGTNPETIKLKDFQIDLDGTALTGVAPFAGLLGRVGSEEGEKVHIGCMVLAKFRNAAGLQQAGNSNYIQTPNSGEPIYTKPGIEGTGTLAANYLEMSNVDVSKEFTDMITTQRGFQANTRIVTVSDEMLNELVNLKR